MRCSVGACQLLAVVAMASVASGFVGPVVLKPVIGARSVSIRKGVSPVRRATPTTMGFVDGIMGPIKGIFNKSPPPEPQSTRGEGAEMFRLLGVSPDADYTVVTEAFERLKKKYADDRKKVIMLEKAKDDIMALRLKQAVAGTLKQTAGAKKRDQISKAKEEAAAKARANKAKKSMFTVPVWAKGWIIPPDREHLRRCLFRHGLFAVFSALIPSSAPTLQAVGAMNAMAMTMNRAAPALKRDEANRVAEVRVPAKRTTLVSLALICTGGFIGAGIGNLLCQQFGETYILMESWQAIAFQSIMFLLCAFVSTWKDPVTGPKTGRRRR